MRAAYQPRRTGITDGAIGHAFDLSLENVEGPAIMAGPLRLCMLIRSRLGGSGISN
jgi:hypothetical protein